MYYPDFTEEKSEAVFTCLKPWPVTDLDLNPNGQCL